MWEKRLKYFNTLKENNKSSDQILSDINTFKTVWYFLMMEKQIKT